MTKSKKYLLVVAVMICVCFMGTVRVRTVKAAGYRLLQKASAEEGGAFVKDSGGWKYIREDGTYPQKTWKKIKNNIFYFDKYGYMQTGWRKYRKSWYYLRTSGKKKGMLVTGWKTVKGRRYYFSKETGARVTGWQTIGKYRYYFSRKGILQKGRNVGGYWLNAKNGRAEKKTSLNTSKWNKHGKIMTSAALAGDSRKVHIFIGDSRTVGLNAAVGGGYYDGQLVSRREDKAKEFYYAKVSSGYSWYSAQALPKLKKLLKQYPEAAVVLNHGINDLDSVDRYISSYRSLMADYPAAKFVIMSVNPVNTKKYKGYAQPAAIEKFNQKIFNAFPDNYLDTYHYLQENKFESPDGLHYDTATYGKIYNYLEAYL